MLVDSRNMALAVATLGFLGCNSLVGIDEPRDRTTGDGASIDGAGTGAGAGGEGGSSGKADGAPGGDELIPESDARGSEDAPRESNDGAADEPTGPTDPVFTVSKLLDDMEDGNQQLKNSNGDWFVIKDASAGTIEPAPGTPFTMSLLAPARDGSTRSVKATVAGLTGWGAIVGFDFSYVMGVRQPTDFDNFLALRFWAKASKATTVKLQLPNGDSDPLGGKCIKDGPPGKGCYDHFTKSFSVGTDWRQVAVLFSDLKQEADGLHVPSFDQHKVYSTFFVLGPNQSVSLWIDDIELVR